MTTISLYSSPVKYNTDMKAICNGCKFQVSGSDNEELENNYRGHGEAFGHAGFCIIDYD